jgi:RNA polymerase sigma factor (sigma-70 family)
MAMAHEDRYQLTPLLERWQVGDRQALEQLLGQLRPFLHARVRSHLGRDLGELDPADVVQDSLSKICAKIDQLQTKTVPSLLRWASTIVYRTLVDAVRRRARLPLCFLGEQTRDLAAVAEEGLGPAEREERSRLVAEAIERLPQRQQRVVRWRYFERLSDEEICTRLGGTSTVGAVRVLRCRALQSLKALLQASAVGGE